MANNKHLVQRGNIWWFVRRVPKDLQHLFPETSRIQQSLHTSDIRVARTKRDAMIGDMQKMALSTMSSQRSLFKRHVKELQAAKAQEEKWLQRRQAAMTPEERRQEQEAEKLAGFPVNGPVWDSVWSPDNVGKEDDKAYVEAFRAVTSGREHSPEFSITLREALDEYVAERNDQVTPTTLTKTRRSCELLLDFMGSKDILASRLERRSVYDWLRHLEKTQAGNTVFSHLSNLRNVYRWLINRGDLTGINPFEGQKVQSSARHEKYQLFEAEELRELNDLMALQPTELNLLFQLGLHTGGRLSELGELRLEQLKLDAPIPHLLIKTGKQKTGTTPKYRTVPIADAMLPMLREQHHKAISTDSQYLFCEMVTEDREDGRVAQGIGAKFSQVKKRVTDQRSKAFHSLRVHAATWCLAQNIPEHITSTLLGHTNGQTMSYAYYAKQNPDLKPYKEAIELLAEKVKEALG